MLGKSVLPLGTLLRRGWIRLLLLLFWALKFYESWFLWRHVRYIYHMMIQNICDVGKSFPLIPVLYGLVLLPWIFFLSKKGLPQLQSCLLCLVVSECWDRYLSKLALGSLQGSVRSEALWWSHGNRKTVSVCELWTHHSISHFRCLKRWDGRYLASSVTVTLNSFRSPHFLLLESDFYDVV